MVKGVFGRGNSKNKVERGISFFYCGSYNDRYIELRCRVEVGWGM